MSKLILPSLLALTIGLYGCTLAPHYERPGLPVAQDWSILAPASMSDAHVSWRDLFTDPDLQKTIELAIANNRDLRVATLNVQKARAQYGIERAGLLPSLDAVGSGSKSHANTPTATTDAKGDSQSYTANLGLSWELDLFGRVQSLKNAAKEDFFAAQENRNAAQISLIAAVADAWIGLAADQDALTLSQQTYASLNDAYAIAQKQASFGAISDLDLNQIETEMEQARANAAADATLVDQDKAALTLLVGAEPPSDLMPSGLSDSIVADSIPVGLASDVLLNRPDILAAEHELKAYNADIGAARAAFFPSISLTGSAGSASSQLDDLFKSASGKWSYGANLSVPIFSGGANLNALRSAKVSRDIAVAQYEQAIQSAFSDVNSALAVRARIDERLQAQSASSQAAQRSLDLSQARYKAGADSYLTLMTAQRTLYASQSSLISLKALKARNLVGLYAAIADDQSLK
jgi:multidrug efflux system outer membrane protein